MSDGTQTDAPPAAATEALVAETMARARRRPRTVDPEQRSPESTAAWNAYEAAGRPEMCPRCGEHPSLPVSPPLCTEPGWSHEASCSTYRYSDELCAECEAVCADGSTVSGERR